MDAHCYNHGWIELAAMTKGGAMVRNKWVRADDKAADLAWRQEFGNTDVYASICSFERPRRDSRFTCPFYADIDCDGNLVEATRQALLVSNLLVNRLGIEPQCLGTYFSGAKGYHVVVPSVVFGEPIRIAGGRELGVWRSLAARLVKEGASNIDLAIYQTSRVLRLPNSVNSKSGLYKTPVEYQELRDYGLEYVLELAKRGREEETMALPEECPRAAAWFSSSLEWVRSRSPRARLGSYTMARFRYGWRVPPCIRAIEEAVLPDGIRHAAYLALGRFYGWIGMHPAEAIDRILTVDQRHPIRDPDCISRVARYGHTHPVFPGCDNPVLKEYCDRRCFRLRERQQPAWQIAPGTSDPTAVHGHRNDLGHPGDLHE